MYTKIQCESRIFVTCRIKDMLKRQCSLLFTVWQVIQQYRIEVDIDWNFPCLYLQKFSSKVTHMGNWWVLCVTPYEPLLLTLLQTIIQIRSGHCFTLNMRLPRKFTQNYSVNQGFSLHNKRNVQVPISTFI